MSEFEFGSAAWFEELTAGGKVWTIDTEVDLQNLVREAVVEALEWTFGRHCLWCRESSTALPAYKPEGWRDGDLWRHKFRQDEDGSRDQSVALCEVPPWMRAKAEAIRAAGRE